jgi:uncharacterized protein DUF3558
VGVQRALLGVLLVLLAGCSTGGDPAPADPPPTEAAAPTTMPLPPRPRDVPIDEVDPCTLLTEAQRTTMLLDRPPQASGGSSVLYPGDVPMCSIRGNEPNLSISIRVVTTAGIEFWTSGQVAAEIRPVQVTGFPAVVAMSLTLEDGCKVILDVAPGQLLDVQSRSAGADPPIPQEQLCRDAEQAAVLVMDTLLSQH